MAQGRQHSHCCREFSEWPKVPTSVASAAVLTMGSFGWLLSNYFSRSYSVGQWCSTVWSHGLDKWCRTSPQARSRGLGWPVGHIQCGVGMWGSIWVQSDTELCHLTQGVLHRSRFEGMEAVAALIVAAVDATAIDTATVPCPQISGAVGLDDMGWMT